MCEIKSGGRLLLFDLDETLIHCTHKDADPSNADVYLDIKVGENTLNAGFNVRKYAKEVLVEASKYFDVAVFTASEKPYGDAVANYLDPKGEIIKYRFFRDSCWKSEEGPYVKDLRIFKHWDLKDVALIDNALYSFASQLDNGILIANFIDDSEDMQLKHFMEYLPILSKAKDMRDSLIKNFKLTELSKLKIEDVEDDEEDSVFDILQTF